MPRRPAYVGLVDPAFGGHVAPRSVTVAGGHRSRRVDDEHLGDRLTTEEIVGVGGHWKDRLERRLVVVAHAEGLIAAHDDEAPSQILDERRERLSGLRLWGRDVDQHYRVIGKQTGRRRNRAKHIHPNSTCGQSRAELITFAGNPLHESNSGRAQHTCETGGGVVLWYLVKRGVERGRDREESRPVCHEIELDRRRAWFELNGDLPHLLLDSGDTQDGLPGVVRSHMGRSRDDIPLPDRRRKPDGLDERVRAAAT